MGDMIRLTIPGKPIGKGRPRATSRGGFVRMYTPKTTAEYERKIQDMFAADYPGYKPISGPVALYIRAYYPIPSSTSKKKARLMEDGDIPCVKKPDLDNVIKTVMDALSGLAYEDDSQVVLVDADKRYSGSGFITILIEEKSCQ